MNQVLVICGPPQFILERRQFWSHPSFQKHTKTTALVLKASDLTPQWQLTSGWINIIIFQAWLDLKSCNTNCVVTVKINSKVMPKELWESKFQIEKVTVKSNFCVLRWPDNKTWIQTVIKTRKEGQVCVCVCVICHNQHCTDQKDQLLQLYLVREIVTIFLKATQCHHSQFSGHI